LERKDDGPTYRDVWSQSGAHGLRLNGPPRAEYRLRVNGKAVAGDVGRSRLGGWLASLNWRVVVRDQTLNVGHYHTGMEIDGARISRAPQHAVLFLAGEAFEIEPCSAASIHAASAGPASDGALRAPMPGKIVAAPAKPGDAVTKGQPIVVLEAMKMEHALVAPFDGVVETVAVAVGEQVADGTVLATVTASN
jgi:3-methylcrotonyl-CoA carboxylase alpha subunit